MNMSDIIMILSGIIFGFVMGQIFFALKIQRAMRKIAKDLNINLETLSKDMLEGNNKLKVVKIVNMFTETTDHSIFAYKKETGEFVAQGQTINDLAENIYKNRQIEFALINHNDEQLYLCEGKISDIPKITQ